MNPNQPGAQATGFAVQTRRLRSGLVSRLQLRVELWLLAETVEVVADGGKGNGPEQAVFEDRPTHVE